jgi:hypothetical protein
MTRGRGALFPIALCGSSSCLSSPMATIAIWIARLIRAHRSCFLYAARALQIEPTYLSRLCKQMGIS